MTKKIAIIGSGVAGLASACRLASRGHTVTVFEANSYPGGKLSLIEQDGYRFDAGPSLFTLPELVEDIFLAAGRNPQDYFRYHPLEVACHYFWPDGTFLKAWSDRERFAAEVEKVLGIPAKTVNDYLLRSGRLYDSAGKLFLERSLHKLSSFLSSDVLKMITRLHELNIFGTMHEENDRKLKDPKLVQLFDRFATYNGSSPYQAPGIMNIIPHLEHNIGSAFPEGGMHAITESLCRLAIELGVDFRFNSPVEEIIVEGKKVKAVLVKGEMIQFDQVVSNMDIYPTYRKLMPSQPAPEKTLKQERSSSALIFYWGIRHSFTQLDLHNIFFSEDYEAEFRQIFQELQIPEDPTIYVNISSKEKPDDAPSGCENWFVMVNVPSNQGQDWDTAIDQLREKIITRLSKQLETDIGPLISSEGILDPRSIESKTSSWQGALYGTSSNNRYAAYLRHPNFHRQLSNLYFCGGSVHPGGGIPLCLLSARIVSELID